jgi:hypothetical protein
VLAEGGVQKARPAKVRKEGRAREDVVDLDPATVVQHAETRARVDASGAVEELSRALALHGTQGR